MRALPDHARRDALARAVRDPAELRAQRQAAAEAVLAGLGPRRDIVEKLGLPAAARILKLPEAAIAIALEDAGRRRRVCALLAARLGVDAQAASATLDALPADPLVLHAAGYLAAVTLALANAPRILHRDRYAAFAARYGQTALEFALEARGPLRGAPDGGAGEPEPSALAAEGPDLLVRALAHSDPVAARALSARLGCAPPEPARDDEDASAPEIPSAPQDLFAPARAALARAALAEAATRFAAPEDGLAEGVPANEPQETEAAES